MAETSIHPVPNLGILGEDLVAAAYDWINAILPYYHQEGSCSTIAELHFRKQAQIAIVLGFPFPDVFTTPTEVSIPPGIDLLVRKDAINAGAADLNWVQRVNGENDGGIKMKFQWA